jgi:hypothetical protein
MIAAIVIAIIALGGLLAGGPLKLFKRFERPVRCQSGHLFTTIWVPCASMKSVRLGGQRYQYCPVGHHWSRVSRLDRASATPAELQRAAETHDIQIA